MRIAVAGGTGTAGRYAVEAAAAAGHETVVLSRRRGVDVRTGAGLEEALAGVDAVIDALNSPSTEELAATAFFTETANKLGAAAAEAGVRHLVLLSIVGLEGASGYGYYAAKLRQERAVRAGKVPATILRSTQFHEFPAQILARVRKGPVALVPRMRLQTVAARTVGEVLVELAAGGPPASPPATPAVSPAATPAGDGGAEDRPAVDLAGPEPGDLVDMAKAVLRRQGRRALVVPLRVPGSAGAAMRGGAMLPGPGARIEGPGFAEWLAGPDLAAVGT